MPEVNVAKSEVALTCVFKNGIVYSNMCGRPHKECISKFVNSTLVQCCRDLIKVAENVISLNIIRISVKKEQSICVNALQQGFLDPCP
ncbi:hypothetical protein TNCV_4691661 [Trichonephila clavipes]|nr:hypothetical protein TNCV_4691661 [Trichonephila clavipes]